MKLQDEQTLTEFANFHCDLDLEDNIADFTHNTLAYDDANFASKKDQQVKKDGTVIYHLNSCCDLDLADSNPNFLRGSPAHANSPTHAVQS